MKQVVLMTSATVTTLALVGCGVSPNGLNLANTRSGDMMAQAVPGEVVVKFRDARGRQSVLQKMGLKAVSKVERIEAVVVKTANAAQTISALKADPNVAYAEPNYIARIIDNGNLAPRMGFGVKADDELLGKLWGMEKIAAAKAWAVTTGSPEVKVGVVDTGIDHKHVDFGGRVAKGKDFVNNDDDAFDDHYHGTHCAGSVGAGLGNGGVVGVAPAVSMVAVKVLSKSGSGSYAGVANGIIYAADQGCQVISMSLGGPQSSAVIDEAVKHAINKGSLVVAAMGNNNSERPSYPAAAPGVMAVGATTSGDVRSSFSNFGKHISVGAPGSDILSTVPGGGYRTLSGTSMACPHTAGLAALVKSANPSFTAAQIRERIEKTADDLGDKGFDKYFGHGRINVGRAITQQ
ncbi:MAG: S8 family peptidase [Candidatus Sericytochromatia bacterium]|nr:S8 family peptidase [Candidatus Sericytochromatia bacterium]